VCVHVCAAYGDRMCFCPLPSRQGSSSPAVATTPRRRVAPSMRMGATHDLSAPLPPATTPRGTHNRGRGVSSKATEVRGATNVATDRATSTGPHQRYPSSSSDDSSSSPRGGNDNRDAMYVRRTGLTLGVVVPAFSWFVWGLALLNAGVCFGAGRFHGSTRCPDGPSG